jgi:glycosyltransferase involved in cell wall biosynthesis
VAARVLPAVRHRPTVLHVHDLVDRVPRHWRAADVVLADSQAVADRLDGLDAHVVFCPVELDPPDVAPPWPAGDGPVVGFVGRIEPRKGPLDLVRAAPAIRTARPDVRIVVMGDDPYRSDPGTHGRCARARTSSTTAGSPARRACCATSTCSSRRRARSRSGPSWPRRWRSARRSSPRGSAAWPRPSTTG